jgi:hypothetical protein
MNWIGEGRPAMFREITLFTNLLYMIRLIWISTWHVHGNIYDECLLSSLYIGNALYNKKFEEIEIMCKLQFKFLLMLKCSCPQQYLYH